MHPLTPFSLLLLLLFTDPADYDKVDPTDRISILGLKDFAPGKGLTLQGKRKDGSTYQIPVNHTFNENQVRLMLGCVFVFVIKPQGLLQPVALRPRRALHDICTKAACFRITS